jgi:hypothetical protein
MLQPPKLYFLLTSLRIHTEVFFLLIVSDIQTMAKEKPAISFPRTFSFIYFLQSMPFSSLQARQLKYLCSSHLSYACYMPCTTQPTLFAYLNIWWTAQIMKQPPCRYPVSPSSSYFQPLKSK